MMVEIPVLQPPNILQDLLGEFKAMFGHRQYRQFCRYMTASWVSLTRSVAHLNGISAEHTNQSNLNRFLMNIDTLDIFRKSVDLINRYCTDPILVLDDTVLQRRGKHIEGAGWIYDHSEVNWLTIVTHYKYECRMDIRSFRGGDNLGHVADLCSSIREGGDIPS